MRLRILNVLKKWIEHNFYEVRENPEILADFEDFVENVVATTQTGKWGEVLVQQYRKAKSMVFIFSKKKKSFKQLFFLKSNISLKELKKNF